MAVVSKSIGQTDDEDSQKLMDFWNDCAGSFADYTRDCLNDTQWIVNKLNSVVPQGKKLRVADLGTGAGLIAVVFAQLGHDVVATDFSPAMIEEARKISHDYNVDIDFRIDDIEHTQLEKETFDLVVVRDVIYNIRNMRKVSSDVVDLIKPGGILMIVDGNYFLHCHDEDYLHRHDFFFVRDRKSEYQRMIDLPGNKYDELEDMVKSFEANRVCRPYDDLYLLTRLGLKNISISCDDNDDYSRLTENGWVNIPFRYTLVGQKPYESADYTKLRNTCIDDPMKAGNTTPEELSQVFEILANPDRLAILNELYKGPSNVRGLSESVRLSDKMTSYHLIAMKDAGLVKSEKNGREVIYSLTDMPALQNMIRLATDLARLKD